jgi:hypothetical protein
MTTTILDKSMCENEMGLDEPRTIQLVSKDETKFDVPEKWANMSGLIKTSLSYDLNTTVLKLNELSGNVLELVVEFMRQCDGKTPPLCDKPLRAKTFEGCGYPCKWVEVFFENILKTPNGKQKLYDLILGANYLDFQELLHLACSKVAMMIKGVPLEELNNLLDPKIAYM